MSFYPRSGGLKKLRPAYNSIPGPQRHRVAPTYSSGYFAPPEHVRAESAVRMMRSGSSQTCYTEATEREEVLLRDDYHSQYQSSYDSGAYQATTQSQGPPSQEFSDSQGPGFSQNSQGDSFGSKSSSQRFGGRGDKSTSLRKLLPHLAAWMQNSSAEVPASTPGVTGVPRSQKDIEKSSQLEGSSTETVSHEEVSALTAAKQCEVPQECISSPQECKDAVDAVGQKCEKLSSLIESMQKDFKDFETTMTSRQTAGESLIVDMQGRLDQQMGLIQALVAGQNALKDQLSNALNTMLLAFGDEIAHMSEGLQSQAVHAVQVENTSLLQREATRAGHPDDDDFGSMCFGVTKSTVVLQLQVKKETVQDLYDDGSNLEEGRKLMEKARRKRHRRALNAVWKSPS